MAKLQKRVARRTKLFVGVTLGLMGVSHAYALGLGDIELNSALNQPLDAEISLLSVKPNEVNRISVRLADEVAFSAAGLDRTALLTRLNFQVVTNSGGVPVVRVTSKELIREPLLDFIVEVGGPSGRLLREYALLVDPPKFASQHAATPVQEPVARVPQRAHAATPPRATARAARVTYAPIQQQPPLGQRDDHSTSAGAPRKYGPITRGETLWDVAETTRHSNGGSIEQMMIALYKENPDAFINDNINNLKAGYVLRIPEPSAVHETTHAQAKREARAHYERWIEADNGLAAGDTLTTGTEVDVAAVTREGSGRADPAAETAEKASSETQTRLVSPEDIAPVDLDRDAITVDALEAVRAERDLALQEAEVARQEKAELANQLAAVEAQTAAMERRITLMERLLTLQAGGPVNIQSVLDLKAEQAGLAGPAEQPRGALALDVRGEQDTAAGPKKPNTEQAIPGQEQGWRDLSMSPWVLGIAGVVGLFLGAMIGKGVRRRRLAESEPRAERRSTYAPGSFAAIHHKESEIVHDAEAEELIRDALRAEPEREDLHLKLLEILYAAGDRERFEAHAEALYALRGRTGGATWSKVREMGSELCRDNTLFSDETVGTVGEGEHGEVLNNETESSSAETAAEVHDELQWQLADEEESSAAFNRNQSEAEDGEIGNGTAIASEPVEVDIDLGLFEAECEAASDTALSEESADAALEARPDDTEDQPRDFKLDPGDTTNVVRGPGFEAVTDRSREADESVAEDTLDSDPFGPTEDELDLLRKDWRDPEERSKRRSGGGT